jgi:hypothetical protein
MLWAPIEKSWANMKRFLCNNLQDFKSVIRESGLIPRSSAPAQIMQRLQKFGIKPDGIINFLSNEPPPNGATLRIPRSSTPGRLISAIYDYFGVLDI